MILTYTPSPDCPERALVVEMEQSMIGCRPRMLVLAGLSLGASWCGAAAGGEGARTPLPELTVPACEAPPYLDGVLTDACWQTAAVVTNLTVLKDPSVSPPHRVHITHDAHWLYLGFAVTHPAPEHLKQTVYLQDGGVFGDDALEIFLDPGTTNAYYAHYGLNAANIRIDQVIFRNGKRDLESLASHSGALPHTPPGSGLLPARFHRLAVPALEAGSLGASLCVPHAMASGTGLPRCGNPVPVAAAGAPRRRALNVQTGSTERTAILCLGST